MKNVPHTRLICRDLPNAYPAHAVRDAQGRGYLNEADVEQCASHRIRVLQMSYEACDRLLSKRHN